MNKKIALGLLIGLIALVLGLYIYGIAVQGDSPTENLARTVAVVFGCLAGVVRLSSGGTKRRHVLSFYESRYEKELKGAFAGSPADRKKLLCGIRFYNEKNYKKAVKYLNSLKPKCRTDADVYAVGLFLALTFTRARVYSEAVRLYLEILDLGVSSSTIYSNLGNLYQQMGDSENAVTYLRLAVQNDPENAYACNNLANHYFDMADMDHAIEYAERALSINGKMRQSATLLAIIYSIKKDKELADKYSHIALAAGESPERLKAAIEHFVSEAEEETEETEETEE